MNPMELARQAAHPYQPPIAGKWQEQWLERFAALVAAHEKKFWMEQIEVECNEAALVERDKALEAAITIGGEFSVEFEKVYLK